MGFLALPGVGRARATEPGASCRVPGDHVRPVEPLPPAFSTSCSPKRAATVRPSSARQRLDTAAAVGSPRRLDESCRWRRNWRQHATATAGPPDRPVGWTTASACGRQQQNHALPHSGGPCAGQIVEVVLGPLDRRVRRRTVHRQPSDLRGRVDPVYPAARGGVRGRPRPARERARTAQGSTGSTGSTDTQ